MKPRWWQLKHLLFSPRKLGKMIKFDEHIFQMGWFNHQLETVSVASHHLRLCVNMTLHDMSHAGRHIYMCMPLYAFIIIHSSTSKSICPKCMYSFAIVRVQLQPCLVYPRSVVGVWRHRIQSTGARHQGRQWRRVSRALLRWDPWSVGWGRQDNF